ncbi:hypothetical protein [Clostridium diolis]|uniref:hypothetical protein n=1 Tax=Clostridium diolis TaxID=223919 RepID=UPI003AF8D55B
MAIGCSILVELFYKVGDEVNLEKSLIEYKKITLTISEIIKSDNCEKLDELFKQRQTILDNIKQTKYSEEELKDFYLKYNIYELDKELEKEMKSEKEELLNKIKENQKRRIAMNGYNNLQNKAVFLSKEF